MEIWGSNVPTTLTSGPPEYCKVSSKQLLKIGQRTVPTCMRRQWLSLHYYVLTRIEKKHQLALTQAALEETDVDKKYSEEI